MCERLNLFFHFPHTVSFFPLWTIRYCFDFYFVMNYTLYLLKIFPLMLSVVLHTIIPFCHQGPWISKVCLNSRSCIDQFEYSHKKHVDSNILPALFESCLHVEIVLSFVFFLFGYLMKWKLRQMYKWPGLKKQSCIVKQP